MNKAMKVPKPGAAVRKPRVLLVDDHPVIRKGVADVLRACPEFEVCGEASTAAEAMEIAGKKRPDAVIADLSLNGPGGLDLIRDLQIQIPGISVLVLSMHDERLYAERALRAGARGYVMKQEEPGRIVEGLRAVMAGDLFVSPDLSEALLRTFVGGGSRKSESVGIERLSDREIQVFEAIGRGQSTADIARQLHLSPKTVETYRAHIKRKLGLENNHGLIHAAIQWVEKEAAGRADLGGGG